MFLIVRYLLQRILPKLFDKCPRFSSSLRTSRETAKFDLIVLERQKQSSFYEVLSTRQKENMLIEEAKVRSRLGVSHLSDQAVKNLMQALAPKK